MKITRIMFNTLYNKERSGTFALHIIFTIHTKEPVTDHDQTVLELTLCATVFFCLFFFSTQASSSKRLTSRDNIQWPARSQVSHAC